MEKFGVTLILPECAFVAELQRDAIFDMIRDIDERLTEQGAPEEAETRRDLMVGNALTLSHLLALKEIDHESGIADIALCFIYAFGKVIGFDQIATLRGLTGTYLRNRLSLNPCLGSDEFEKETLILQQKMVDHADTDFERNWTDDRIRPSIH